MNRRAFLVAGAGVVAAGAVGTYGVRADSGMPASATNTASWTPAVATVTRGDLAAVRDFRATISFGDPWPLESAVHGIVTASLPRGAVLGDGDEVVRVDDRPLILAIGTMPMYRTLEKVDTRIRDENNRRRSLLEGDDVLQLQRHLLAAGFDANGSLTADGVFGRRTEEAVEAWQTALGLSVTGRVDSSQLVFSSEPLRIARELRVGSPFQGIEVTRPEATVLVDTSSRDRSALSPGTSLVVVLASDERLAGRAEGQEQTTGADGGAVWRTTITTTEALPDVSTATVEVREGLAADAILVPASALLALAEGGFAVERRDAAGSTLIGVEVTDVLDGLAAVTGDLDTGDSVVVPT